MPPNTASAFSRSINSAVFSAAFAAFPASSSVVSTRLRPCTPPLAFTLSK
jgi:hypothetical protein